MTVLELITNLCLRITDPLLGWLLHLPADLAIVIVAIATSAILTFVRIFTTNQDLLGRCKQDKKRLKELIRESKVNKDPEARKRYRTTVSGMSMKLMAAEGKPLLVSLVPIALLAVWCFSRLEFIPPRADEPVEVKVFYKMTAIGRLTHMVPQEGFSASQSWVQRIDDDPDTQEGVPPNGLAVWTLTPEAGQPRTCELAIHYGGKTYTKALEVGGRTYAPSLEFYGEDEPVICTEVKMDPYRPFRFVPGIPFVAMPPWLVAYLGIAVPFVFVLKWLFHIY